MARKFKCELCGKRFKTPQGVGYHIARGHRKIIGQTMQVANDSTLEQPINKYKQSLTPPKPRRSYWIYVCSKCAMFNEGAEKDDSCGNCGEPLCLLEVVSK